VRNILVLAPIVVSTNVHNFNLLKLKVIKFYNFQLKYLKIMNFRKIQILIKFKNQWAIIGNQQLRCSALSSQIQRWLKSILCGLLLNIFFI